MRVISHGLTKETFSLCVNKVIGMDPPVWGSLTFFFLVSFHPSPGHGNWEGIDRLSVKGNRDQSCGDVTPAAWNIKKAEDSKDASWLTAVGGLVLRQAGSQIVSNGHAGSRSPVQAVRDQEGRQTPLQVVSAADFVQDDTRVQGCCCAAVLKRMCVERVGGSQEASAG